MIYHNFKNLKSDLIDYFDNNQFKFAYSHIKSRKFIWISDKERYFDELIAHYEFIVENNIVSIDLHFENIQHNQVLFDLLILKLPPNVIEKKWHGKALTHIKKFHLDSDIVIEDIIICLNELYNFSYPILLNRLKEIYPQKSPQYVNMQNNIKVLEYKKQIILQGPPGTGKTRLAKELALKLIGDDNNINLFDYLKTDVSIPNASGVKDYYLIEEVKEKVIVLSSEKAAQKWNASFKKISEMLVQLQSGEKPENKSGDDPYVLAAAKYVFEKVKNFANSSENNPQLKLIQFHPSYTYEDFVRGIVAQSKGDQIEYKNVNKTLGLFAKEALKNFRSSKKVPELISKENWTEENYLKFKEDLEKKLQEGEEIIIKVNTKPKITTIEEDALRVNRYSNEKDSILVKDSDIIDGYIGFHLTNPSIKINENFSLSKSARSGMYYVYQNLVEKFNQFLESNSKKFELTEDLKPETLKNFILVIDEINRANLSSVLGELIYALEYRGEAVESMYAIDDDTKLILPPNLYIIGTMNTADRSVGHIDYAIRRRFAFVDVLPKNLKAELGTDFDESLFMEVANLFIANYDPSIDYSKELKNIRSVYLNSDFDPKEVWLGHSYFIKQYEKDDNGKNIIHKPYDFKMRLDYEIKPILLEYVKDGILKESAKVEIEKLKATI